MNATVAGKAKNKRRLRVGFGSADAAYEFPTRKNAAFQFQVSDADQRELGASGVLRGRDGLAAIDPNAELAPTLARGLWSNHGVYHEMLYTDPIIFGVASLLCREITRARYRVVVPSNPTPEEARAARMVERFFGLDGTEGWLQGGLRRLLWHGTQSFFYGFSACEITWTVETFEGEPVLVPSKAAWRAPWSVERWLWQGERLVGLQQAVQSQDARTVGASANGMLGMVGASLGFDRESVTIPANRLLLWSHDAVDGNPEGRSMLRPAYRYWQLKQNTLRRIERSEETLWGGTTIIKEMPGPDGGPHPSISDDDIDYAFDIVEQRLANMVKAMVEPIGLELRTDWPDYEIEDRTNYLTWVDHQLLMVMSGQVFGLSASHAGSKALAGGMGQVFYSTAADLAGFLCDVINGQTGLDHTGLVSRFLHANLPHSEGFRVPRLEAVGIEHQDHKAHADVLTKLAQFRLFTPSARDEQHVRRQFHLEDLALEEIEALRAAAAAQRTRTDEEQTQAPQSGQPLGSEVDQGEDTE